MMPADRIIAELASAQGGVVARHQLRARGVTVSQVRSRVSNGRLIALEGGSAFVAGGAPVSDHTALHAAVLLIPGAVASHDSAARLHHLHAAPAETSHHVTVDLGSAHRIEGVTVHRSSDLDEQGRVNIAGIPCTTVDRTLVDLGATWSRPRLTQSIEQAMVDRLATPESLRRELDRVARHGRRGVALVRAVLDELGSRTIGVESALELDLARLVLSSGIPQPVRQWCPPWGGTLIERVDCAFIEARVIIEVDGRSWHERRAQSSRDRLRDQLAVTHGWVVLRFDAAQIRRDPDSVIASIVGALAARSAA